MTDEQTSHGGGLRLPPLIVDQGLYAASNFALAVAAGQALPDVGFGRFAAIALAVSIVVNLVRAVWHEPNLAAGPARPGRSNGRGTRPAVALAILVALPLVPGLAPDGGVGVTATVLSALGLALMQDRARFRAIASDRARELILGDATWVAVVAVGLGANAVGAIELSSISALFRLWSIGAAAGLAVLLFPTAERVVPERREPSNTTGYRLTLLTDFLMLTGMTQIGGLALAAFLPLDQYGPLRGAIILFGPVGVVTTALATWIFASIEPDAADAGSLVRTASFRVAGFGLLVTSVVVAMPTGIGELVLGSGWPSRTVAALIGLSVSCQALSTPAMMLLRRRDERRRLLSLRIGAVALFLCSTTAAAVTTRATGPVAAAYLATSGALALAAWLTLGRLDMRPRPSSQALVQLGPD